MATMKQKVKQQDSNVSRRHRSSSVIAFWELSVRLCAAGIIFFTRCCAFSIQIAFLDRLVESLLDAVGGT